MRLFALSDLHLASVPNRRALEALGSYPDDWLIVAGDVAERFQTVEWALSHLAERFARVIWVPGNHELWSIANREPPEPRGVARYDALVERVRALGVLTPEDPYPLWSGALPDDVAPGVERLLLVPLFLLYDYSFRPADVALEDVIPWAEEAHNVCSDELLLAPEPHADRITWCRERLALSQARLAEALVEGTGSVLINHWPFRRDLVRIPRVPRFTPWCGTVETHEWHRRYRAYAAVSGHLHTRRTDVIDGTRFEEVSLGYPRQWDTARPLDSYLRRIL